jgi:hypothetical protein
MAAAAIGMEGWPMFSVLRERPFALLFSGALVSTAGDLVLLVALPFWTFRLTGSVACSSRYGDRMAQ